MRTCAIDGCDKPHRARGWCRKHYYRWARQGDPHRMAFDRGGDAIGYRAAHLRVDAGRGRASEYPCAHCGGQAHEWAYDHADPNERVGRSGQVDCPYSADPDHYTPLCVSCHRVFDGALGVRACV